MTINTLTSYEQKDRDFTFRLFETLKKCPKFVDTFVKHSDGRCYGGEMSRSHQLTSPNRTALVFFEDLIEDPTLLDSVFHQKSSHTGGFNPRWPSWDRWTTADRLAAVEWFYGDSCAEERQSFIDARLNVSGESSWAWIHSSNSHSKIHGIEKAKYDSRHINTYQAFITPQYANRPCTVTSKFPQLDDTSDFFDQNIFALIDAFTASSYKSKFDELEYNLKLGGSGSYQFTRDGIRYSVYANSAVEQRKHLEFILALWKHYNPGKDVDVKFLKDPCTKPHGDVMIIGSETKQQTSQAKTIDGLKFKPEYQPLKYKFDAKLIADAIDEIRATYRNN